MTVYNLGIRRDTSHDIAGRWHAEALARQPAGLPGALVFSFGVNDCCEEPPGRVRVAPAASLAAARRILAQACALRPTLMVGPPPIADAGVNRRVAALSVALGDVCASLSVPFLDIFTPLSGNAVWRAEVAGGDGAHPAAGGYGALAELVAAWPAWQAVLTAPSPPPCG